MEAIPHVQGIEIYGDSITAGTGGDLFEHINFQQRHGIDASIEPTLIPVMALENVEALKEYLEKLPAGATPRNSVDDHVNWLKSRPGYRRRWRLRTERRPIELIRDWRLGRQTDSFI